MIQHRIVLRTFVLLVALAVNAGAQTPGRIDQGEIARQLFAGGASERGAAVAAVRHIRAEDVGPHLRSALIAALEQEGRVIAQFRGERARGVSHARGDPELIAGLAHIVSAFRDPRSIPALASALGTSPPATAALAEFGETAASDVINVLSNTSDLSVEHDALLVLRLMAQGVGGQALSTGTRARIRQIAKEILTTPQQSVVTVWRAIDLAEALTDGELRGLVQLLASNRSAITALCEGLDPDLVARTQRIATERLAGVQPRPQHTSVEEFARRWD